MNEVTGALLAAIAAFSFSGFASAQASGDFTGQPASGSVATRPYGCYPESESGLQAPLSDGSCPPNTTYGIGFINNQSTQYANITQVPSGLASQIQITANGNGPGANNTYVNYGVALPLSDFATATSVSAIAAAQTQITAMLNSETTRAMEVESELSQVINNETKARIADVARISRHSNSATATAVALGGAGFIPGKTMNLTFNVGAYRGESAVSVQGSYVLNPNTYLNIGFASATGGGGTAARTGVTLGW